MDELFLENIFKWILTAKDLRNYLVLFPIFPVELHVEHRLVENHLRLLNETVGRVKVRQNGTIVSEVFFRNRKKYGKYREFFPNGVQKTEGNYVNGEFEGTHREWYSNGNLMDEVYYKNGDFNGPFTAFFDNGNIQSTGQFKDGKEDGIWYYWNRELNRPETKTQYLDGKMVLESRV
jgi:antitoxin component YwqK of YwqJK toxin-antitoxin module